MARWVWWIGALGSVGLVSAFGASMMEKRPASFAGVPQRAEKQVPSEALIRPVRVSKRAEPSTPEPEVASDFLSSSLDDPDLRQASLANATGGDPERETQAATWLKRHFNVVYAYDGPLPAVANAAKPRVTAIQPPPKHEGRPTTKESEDSTTKQVEGQRRILSLFPELGEHVKAVEAQRQEDRRQFDQTGMTPEERARQSGVRMNNND